MSLFDELKRRNVFKVATAYVVVGWLLTEIATTLLPTFGAPEWVAKAIIFLFALAFIPVLVFAWAFELTPEGIKREKNVDRTASITSETGKKLSYITIVAVLIGVVFVAFTRTAEQVPDAEPEIVVTEGTPSVAVLPFVNMSGNAENEYFSDGLTETLLHMLAQIPDLRVAARTSSFAFKGQDEDIREIAAALDVAHILEGSVQRAGNRVRITAQLIRANDGFHVWSENFDRTLDDIFAIQDEIAGKVGKSLSASLLNTADSSPLVSVGTENLEAYDRFLQAVAEHRKGSYGALQIAEGLLKDALALDPGFLDAKTQLAVVYSSQYKTGLITQEAGLENVTMLLDQVLAKRPDDVRATTLLYDAEWNEQIRQNDWEGARNALALLEEHASKHPTDVETVLQAAGKSSFFGTFAEENLRLLQGLTEIDPLNPAVYMELARVYSVHEKWPETRALAERSLELEPRQPLPYALIGQSQWSEGNVTGWLTSILTAMEIDPQDHEIPGGIAARLYLFGLPEQATEFRERVLAIAPTSPVAHALEVLNAEAQGDLDRARAAARDAVVKGIENRGGAYSDCASFLVRDALANDTAQEALQFFESVAPSLANFDSEVADIREQLLRFVVNPLWQVTLPEAEWERRFVALVEYLLEIREFQNKDTLPLAGMHIVNDDLEAATAMLTRIFANESVVQNWRMNQAINFPIYADVRDDPRIQEALAKYENDKIELRESVRALLEQRSRN